MKENIKVAFVIPSLGSGGAERVVSNLSNEFTALGMKVSVIMLANRNLYYTLDKKVDIEYLDCEKDNSLPFLKRYKLRLKKIRSAVKKINPDVIISFMSETNIDVCFAMRGLKIPLIVSERNDPAIDPASKAKQYMRKIAYKKPTGFVFQTPDARAYFSKKIQSKSTIIINPLSATLPEAYEGERDKRVVSVGRLNKQKNFPILFDAFKEFSLEYPDYKLEIYGEGLLEEKLKDYITELGMEDKIFLMGFCKDVHEKTKTAAMFVMSSDFEGMPNALLESMAIGLPCISTDCPCGGPRMLVKNKENGILVSVKSSSEILEAMKYMVTNPDEAVKMGKNAQNIKAEANVSAITKKWVDYIAECIGE